MRNSVKISKRLMAWALPGALVLGTTCASEIRDAAVSAGLDFAEGTFSLVLETLLPVEDIITGGE